MAGASSNLLPQLANLDTFQDATVCKSYSDDTQVAHSDSTPSDGFHSDSTPSDDDDDYGIDTQAEDSWLTAKAIADAEDRWLMNGDPDENDPAHNLVDLDPSEGRRRGDLLMSMLDMTGGTYPVNSADKINSRSGASKNGMNGSRLLASAPSFMPSIDMSFMWNETGPLTSAPAVPPAMPPPRQPLQDAIARHHMRKAAESSVVEKKTPLRSPLVSSAPAFRPTFALPPPGPMPSEDPPHQQGSHSAFESVLCMGASYGSNCQEGQCWDFMQTGECWRKACRWAHVQPDVQKVETEVTLA